jgi:hypothetical protein
VDLSRLLRHPFAVQHVTQDGPPDERGDPTEQTTYTVCKGYRWQTSADERTGAADIAVGRDVVALERSIDGQLDEGDRIFDDVELDGDGAYVEGSGTPYDVDGPPWRARDPRTDRVEYILAKLVRSS